MITVRQSRDLAMRAVAVGKEKSPQFAHHSYADAWKTTNQTQLSLSGRKLGCKECTGHFAPSGLDVFGADVGAVSSSMVSSDALEASVPGSAVAQK